MRDERIGMVLSGRYEIEKVLAQGGMSILYVARHRTLDERYAIKILSSSLVRNKVVRERFAREAKATQRLAHPNIIEIMDHGETDDGHPYLVMEYLRGENLADVIARGALNEKVALPIAIQISRALSRAHDFDVIHRDLKPENVFLCANASEPPIAKLLDFGIARSLHDARLTTAGEVFGTPQYMAPERIVSIDAGPSADLYSLGMMMFEMLVGTLPFDGADVTTLFVFHMNKVPPTLLERGVKTSPRLSALVASLLEKNENQRPVDAHAVTKELIEICNERGIAIPPEPPVHDVEQPAHSGLPSASIYQWNRRTEIFEKMLAAAYPQGAPAAMRELLDSLQNKVNQLRTQLDQVLENQRQLTELENKSKTGRQQFGVAVQRLGIDASLAREQARKARQAEERSRKQTEALRTKAQSLQGQVLMWEGRSAFQQPYRQLAQAYRAMADAVDAWWESAQQNETDQQQTMQLESVVADLEYQISELRAGLQRLETTSERERKTIEQVLTKLDQQATDMEQDVLAMASRLCDPMRDNPHVQPLFRELESHGPSLKASIGTSMVPKAVIT